MNIESNQIFFYYKVAAVLVVSVKHKQYAAAIIKC